MNNFFKNYRDCGYYAISSEQCEALGCCYNGVSTDQPICATKTTPDNVLGRDVIDPPIISASYYVDKENGNDNNDGLSVATAWKELRLSIQKVLSGSAIYVLNGTYTNWRYGEGNLNNPAALAIQHTSDILISAYNIHQ